MHKFYVNGNSVSETYARLFFYDQTWDMAGMDKQEARAIWDQCLQSEAARDDWFQGGLEMVAQS